MKLVLDTGNFAIALHVEKLDAGMYGVGLGFTEEGEQRWDTILTLDEARALHSLLDMVLDAAEDATNEPRSESAEH